MSVQRVEVMAADPSSGEDGGDAGPGAPPAADESADPTSPQRLVEKDTQPPPDDAPGSAPSPPDLPAAPPTAAGDDAGATPGDPAGSGMRSSGGDVRQTQQVMVQSAGSAALTAPDGSGLKPIPTSALSAHAQGGKPEIPVWPNIRMTSERPCCCCGSLCGAWLLAILVLIIVMAVGGVGMSLDVPFYNRKETYQTRVDAYRALVKDADLLSIYGQNLTQPKCAHAPPTMLSLDGTLQVGPAQTPYCQSSTTHMLRIEYVSKSGNILTESNLMKIREIEDHLMGHAAMSKWCHLVPSSWAPITEQDRDDGSWEKLLSVAVGRINTDVATTDSDRTFMYPCSRMSSVLSFMDDGYFDMGTPTRNATGLGYWLSQAAIHPMYKLSQTNVDKVANHWADYTTTAFSLSALNVEVSNTLGHYLTVPNLFYYTASSDFKPGHPAAAGVMSLLRLGLPIHGYNLASVDAKDQHRDIGTWLWEEFDSYLKDASWGDVDVSWNDDKGGMLEAESGALMMQSMVLIIFSFLFVWLYLAFMLDSWFLACTAIMQIFLCFVPGLIIYVVIFQQSYLGVLNMIAIFIILGIGVDDIFVFCDQWALEKDVKDKTQRLQRAYKTATKAMFTTSCTTFISFMSNAGSAFPAVATFGMFSASLVLCNFSAVITFWPAVYSLYYTHIRPHRCDHPSSIWRKCKEPELDEGGGNESALSRFFRDKWTPLILKGRYVIMLIFLAILIGASILATGLEPDPETPNTLPDDNNYKIEKDVLLKHFMRSGNPTAITVHWLSGIDPNLVLDRSGTVDTDSGDYGKPVFADCPSVNSPGTLARPKFDPLTAAAQAWGLKTCHDVFFGNVTEYHDSDASYAPGGANGPEARKMTNDVAPMTEQTYGRVVRCPMQLFRDWLISDAGCIELTKYGLDCVNATRQRPGCRMWDPADDGIHSCEPFPVPTALSPFLFTTMTLDPVQSAGSGTSNLDTLSELMWIDDLSENDGAGANANSDFSCLLAGNKSAGDVYSVLRGMDNILTLTQDIAINYEDGLALIKLWENWEAQMLRHAPPEMTGTMQFSDFAWWLYKLNETLLNETFSGIFMACVFCWIVLAICLHNPIMASLAVGTIVLIVIDVFAFTVICNFKLGVLEAVNYVVVIGMSIDYCVHMSEAYAEAHARERVPRVQAMIHEMGQSVLSGACSTLGCCFFMFFAPNTFFFKFACFMFCTIILSCIYALTFYPAMLSIIGPQGDTGNVLVLINRLRGRHHAVTALEGDVKPE